MSNFQVVCGSARKVTVNVVYAEIKHEANELPKIDFFTLRKFCFVRCRTLAISAQVVSISNNNRTFSINYSSGRIPQRTIIPYQIFSSVFCNYIVLWNVFSSWVASLALIHFQKSSQFEIFLIIRQQTTSYRCSPSWRISVILMRILKYLDKVRWKYLRQYKTNDCIWCIFDKLSCTSPNV